MFTLLLIILSVNRAIFNSSVFENVQDETIKCYYCVNKTMSFDDCPYDTIKRHTCVSYADLLNRKVIENHQMLHVVFKCATVQYKGK